MVIDFDDTPIFNALAYACIFVAVKKSSQKNSSLSWLKVNEIADTKNLVSSSRNQSVTISQNLLTNDKWSVAIDSPNINSIFLRHVKKPLKEWTKKPIRRGILTGLNKAFVINETTMKTLLKSDKSLEKYFLPYLRGKKDIQNSQCYFNSFFLIAIKSSANEKYPWSGLNTKDAEKVFRNLHPSLYTWFSQFRNKLISRADQGHYYWELRSCNFWDDFEARKILIPTMCLEPEAASDNVGYCINDKINFIVTENPNLLSGLLLSTCTWSRLRMTAATRQNGYIEVKPLYLKELEIPCLSQKTNEAISSIVEIYGNVKRNVQEKIELVKKIDWLIEND